ncbi:MAG: hypothetical protein ACI9BW_001515 [Gammaproteobacteria bacterium]|jgi:hypothetical protein
MGPDCVINPSASKLFPIMNGRRVQIIDRSVYFTISRARLPSSNNKIIFTRHGSVTAGRGADSEDYLRAIIGRPRICRREIRFGYSPDYRTSISGRSN